VITNLAIPTRTTFLDISSKISGGCPVMSVDYLGWPFIRVTRPPLLLRLLHHQRNASGPTGSLYLFAGNSKRRRRASEQILIDQLDEAGNHNAGDLHFGPDAYLYVSLGDEGNGDDSLNNSQRLDKDFFSGILRIDVDKRPGNLAPNVHPSSSATTASPSTILSSCHQFEWSHSQSCLRPDRILGHRLRNPWRTSFDPMTGRTLCGRCRPECAEEVDVIVKGGNYGWNYVKGKFQRPGSGAPPASFSAIESHSRL